MQMTSRREVTVILKPGTDTNTMKEIAERIKKAVPEALSVVVKTPKRKCDTCKHRKKPHTEKPCDTCYEDLPNWEEA
jgi:hypothetical protein